MEEENVETKCIALGSKNMIALFRIVVEARFHKKHITDEQAGAALALFEEFMEKLTDGTLLEVLEVLQEDAGDLN